MFIFAIDQNTGNCLSISDWILICTTLFLGGIAIGIALFSESVKRRWFSPKLKIEFKESPPWCHLTDLIGQNINEPCFYFRFRVTNVGKSTARNCESVLENLQSANAAGKFPPSTTTQYTPVNLNWGSSQGEYININPKRRCFRDLLHVPSKKYQSLSLDPNVNPRHCAAFPIGFLMDVKFHPYA